MSYFDDASLVMIPSGYKTSKVYSVKPTDGSGDLTFSRSNDTATRVGPDGLIEKVRTNLILQSETFDNASWSKTDVAITANTTANPLNGALTADTITLTGATSQKSIAQSLSQNGLFTQSAYLKAGTHQFVQFLVGGDVSRFAAFDLVNGTSSVTGGVATITAVANGFYRCTFSYTTAIGTNMTIIAVDSLAAARADTTASTGTFIAFGCQVESGDIATDYIATTSAAVSVGPVANVPRLDYLNSSCPRLLLEPQRTNLALYSEQLDNAWWAKLSASALANDAISPDGYTNADKIRPNSGVSFSILSGGIYTAGASSYIRSTGLTLTAASYTFSAFVKKGEYDHIQLRSGTSIDTTTNGSGVVVNLNNGTTTATSGYSIEDYGDGWYRISHTFTATAATWYLNFWFWNSTSVTANGTNGVYVYGAQLEAGAYATSYIPTLGAAVTRGADSASKTGISSLIGQTEGTMFAEVNLSRVNADPIFTISDGTDANRIQIVFLSSTQLLATIRVAGVNHNLAVNVPSVPSTGGIYKIGLGYKADDFCFSLNGTNYTSTATRPVPACSVVAVGASATLASFLGDRISQALLFKTRLSNADLAALTA